MDEQIRSLIQIDPADLELKYFIDADNSNQQKSLKSQIVITNVNQIGASIAFKVKTTSPQSYVVKPT